MKKVKLALLLVLIAAGLTVLSACSSSRRLGCPMKISSGVQSDTPKNC